MKHQDAFEFIERMIECGDYFHAADCLMELLNKTRLEAIEACAKICDKEYVENDKLRINCIDSEDRAIFRQLSDFALSIGAEIRGQLK